MLLVREPLGDPLFYQHPRGQVLSFSPLKLGKLTHTSPQISARRTYSGERVREGTEAESPLAKTSLNSVVGINHPGA